MVVILTILVSIFLPLSLQAYDIQGCKDCHKATLDKDNSKKYLHPPFLEEECEECHVASAVKVYSVSQIDWRKINWLVESFVMDANHGFVLPDDKLRDTLVVKLYGNIGELSRHVIALPSLIDLSEVEDTGNPPTISNVQVLKVKRGVFISATVGWETDTLSDASVRYGNEDLLQSLKPNNRLARKHQVALSNLQPDRT